MRDTLSNHEWERWSHLSTWAGNQSGEFGSFCQLADLVI